MAENVWRNRDETGSRTLGKESIDRLVALRLQCVTVRPLTVTELGHVVAI